MTPWTPGPEWTLTDTGGGLKMWSRALPSGCVAFLGDDEGGMLTNGEEICAFSIWRGDDELHCEHGVDDASTALRMIGSWVENAR